MRHFAQGIKTIIVVKKADILNEVTEEDVELLMMNYGNEQEFSEQFTACMDDLIPESALEDLKEELLATGVKDFTIFTKSSGYFAPTYITKTTTGYCDFALDPEKGFIIEEKYKKVA